MEMNEKEVDLALIHAKEKTLEGLLEWITDYQEDPSIINAQPKTDTKMEIEGEGGDGKMEEEPKEEAKEEGQPQEEKKEEVVEEVAEVKQAISGMVNQDLVKQLTTLGYNKHVAEKSIFMTQAKEAGKALDWIEQHKNDPDFEEQLFIVNANPKQTG